MLPFAIPNLNSPAVHFHASYWRSLTGRTALLLGQGELQETCDLLVALGRSFRADAFGRPHDPLVGDIQFGQVNNVFAGLPKAGGMAAGMNHLLQYGRRNGGVYLKPQRAVLREKEPCDNACNSTSVVARKHRRVGW